MLEMIFRFTCSACGTQKEERYQLTLRDLHPYNIRPSPVLPERWKIVGVQLFCEKEKVHVRVTDGDRIFLNDDDYRWMTT